MTGPEDTSAPLAQSRGVEGMMDNGAHRLALLFMREIEAAEAWDGETDDGVRTDKRCKALISMAKAGQAIRQLARPEPPEPPVRQGGAGQRTSQQLEETDMDDDISDDPARLEILRDTLERRLERIARTLEAKGRPEPPAPGAAAGAEPQLAAERPPGPAPA